MNDERDNPDQPEEQSAEPVDPPPPLPEPSITPDTLEEERHQEGPSIHG